MNDFKELNCSCKDKECNKKLRIYKPTKDKIEILLSNKENIYPYNGGIILKNVNLIKMDRKQKDYLIKLIKHDLEMYDFWSDDDSIAEDKIEELLQEIREA